MLSGTAAVIIYWLVSEFTGMYRNWRGVSSMREIMCALGTWTLTLPAVVSLRWLRDHFGEPHAQFDPLVLVAWYVLAFVLLAGPAAGHARLAAVAALQGAEYQAFRHRGSQRPGVPAGPQYRRDAAAGPEAGRIFRRPAGPPHSEGARRDRRESGQPSPNWSSWPAAARSK